MKATDVVPRSPEEFVYHASFLPELTSGLQSILQHGLTPSKTGYAGPGVYFAYTPDGGFYHVDKADATLFRAKWKDLVELFGLYPKQPNGIQRDNNEIIVPKVISADLLEVEFFPDEWWDIESAYHASKGPTN